jgi:hypothetical protein
VGKYGTNLEGFGAFEGGVNADKGAPLVSTSSDGETALLFGPAALREIQAGVANGDFAIPPDEADATITAENPLPYWTFTDVNSAGAITCAIVEDSGNSSGNAIRFSIAASTTTGKSAKITRQVTVIPGSTQGTDSVSYAFEYAYVGVTTEANARVTATLEYYNAAGTLLTTTAPSSAFVTTFPSSGTVGYDYTTGQSQHTLCPINAAYAVIALTVSTTGTTAASVKSIDIRNTRLETWPHSIFFAGRNATDSPVPVWNESGTLTVNGNIAVAQGYVYFELSDGATPRSIALVGTNLRLLSASSTHSADFSSSTSSTRSGVLITKVTAGQPSTNINGTATTDAFADALRNGGIAVDTTNNRGYFYSGGWKYAALTTPSDSRLKEEITDITGALDTLRQLVPVAFKWKRPEAHGRSDAVADDGTRLGFIADQVATTDLAHWVETLGVDEREADLVDTTEVLAVNIPQNEMEALLVQALLDIDTRLKALESR